MPKRTFWFAPDLTIPNKPLWIQLVKFRRWPAFQSDRYMAHYEEDANLISSITDEPGIHLPVLDLDEPHEFKESSTPGHSHLYLNRPIRTWRWVILMIGLRVGHVIEPGTFVWSLRRGGNFVRIRGDKTDAERVYPEYGWFFKKKRRS